MFLDRRLLGCRSRFQRRLASGRHFCQTKIENLGVAAFGNKDVRRLYVAVDYAFRVGRVERVRNLDGDRQDRLDFHGTAGYTMLQGQPVQKLHDDERLPLVFPNLVDDADVGVI